MGDLVLCTTCNIEKPRDDFYHYKNRPTVKRGRCKKCTKEYNRQRDSIPEIREKRLSQQRERTKLESVKKEAKQRSKKFYDSPSGRAKTLIKGIKDRIKKKDFEESLDFDYKWLQGKIEKGFCEVTGLPFVLNSEGNSKKNPYSPSVDRIDCSKGYFKDNVRVVIWQFNLMKGEMRDEELKHLIEIVRLKL